MSDCLVHPFSLAAKVPRDEAVILKIPAEITNLNSACEVKPLHLYFQKREKKNKIKQGLQFWRFRAKVAILKDQWRQTFGGDSPLKKWRFWKLWGRRQKVAILGRKLAILGQKLAIFGPFLGGKISTD